MTPSDELLAAFDNGARGVVDVDMRSMRSVAVPFVSFVPFLAGHDYLVM